MPLLQMTFNTAQAASSLPCPAWLITSKRSDCPSLLTFICNACRTGKCPHKPQPWDPPHHATAPLSCQQAHAAKAGDGPPASPAATTAAGVELALGQGCERCGKCGHHLPGGSCYNLACGLCDRPQLDGHIAASASGPAAVDPGCLHAHWLLQPPVSLPALHPPACGSPRSRPLSASTEAPHRRASLAVQAPCSVLMFLPWATFRPTSL